jgi:hypothetical protein
MKATQRDALLKTLKARFEKHMNRHKGVDWAKVQARLESKPDKLRSLYEMEETGGEPDVVGEYVFYDCSAESPSGRRSVCYDRKALDARKDHNPKNIELDRDTAGHQASRGRHFCRLPLRPCLRVSQRGRLVLCRQGIPRLAPDLREVFSCPGRRKVLPR